MEKIALVGLFCGFTWGAAGMVGYGVRWFPGVVVAVACLLFLSANHALPPEPLIEAWAVGSLLVLMFARNRAVARKAEEKAEPTAE